MALCLVFCSTLAALVSIMPVLCSLILHSLRSWVIYGNPLTVRFEQNSSSKAQPWFYHLPHLSLFPLGFRSPRVIFIYPPGQFSSECWSKSSDVRCPLGNQGLCQPDILLIRCALRTRYVQLLSGFVDTSGGFAGLVLPLSKCLVNRDSETDRVFPGEGISFIDRESL